jgi:hypothetical protein
MKKSLFTMGLAMFAFIATAQDDKADRPSPPATATGEVNGKTITIDYSQPSVKGRVIFGGLQPYDTVWRAGANETTTIEVSDDVTVGGKALPKGKYGFFIIPNKEEWTIIINTGIEWGAFTYKESEDVLRINVPVEKTDLVEKLTYTVSSDGNVSLAWANSKVSFSVQ